MRFNHGLIWFLLLVLFVVTPVLYIKKRLTIPEPMIRIPVTLMSKADGRIYHLDLEQYLVGVVAAEMPAEFSIEALKAQAVAARTLTVRRLRRYGGSGCQHYQGVDFCDDPAESQAWISLNSLKSKWGSQYFSKFYWKVEKAVTETKGEIMVYQNVRSMRYFTPLVEWGPRLPMKYGIPMFLIFKMKAVVLIFIQPIIVII